MTTKRRADTASAVMSIRRIVRVLRVAAQRTQTTTGVSAAQVFVLEQLGDDMLSLNELAMRTLTDRTSVAAVVDRLQAQRLVARAVDPDDRRRASIRITAAGRRLLAQSPHAPMTGLLKALRTLEPARLSALAASLRALVDALGAADAPAPFLFTEERASRSGGKPNRPRRRKSS